MKTAYKVFYQPKTKAGLFPPMVPNKDGLPTPIGEWVEAVPGEIAGTTKTGRVHVKAGGKGTHTGKMTLAYRPGWHLGVDPDAPQFLHNDGTWPIELVFALVEYDDSRDLTEEARKYGMTASGKYQHSLAGLPYVPQGFYRYRTNPRPDTPEWIITGKIRVTHVLSLDETNAARAEAGLPPLVAR